MAANSYRNVFLTNLSTIPSSGTTLDLGIGEIGIVNVKTNTLTSIPNFPVVRSIQVAQGTTDAKLPKGMMYGNQTWRTPEILPSSDIKFEALKAQRLQNMIVTLGYDGIDTDKTMAPREGKDVMLYITLTGQPIANLVGNTGNHPASITETFYLNLPCVDECADNCGDTVDCTAVADAIIKQVSERKTIGSINLVDGVNGEPGLLRLTKLLSCDTPSALPTTTCHKWELVIADAGNQIALGTVEAQYPGITVTRTLRSGIYSTYQLIVCDGSTPTAFNDTAPYAIPDCTTCPSGYTLQAELPVFTIGRTDDGDAAALATLKTDFAGLIVLSSARVASRSNGWTTYEVYGNAGVTITQINTRATTVSKGDVATDIGTVQAVCIPTGNVTTAWTDTGESCAVATKYYQITLKDDICGTSKLAELQAIYGAGVTQFANNSSNCTREYRLAVNSSNFCVECADITEQYFTFTKPQNFGTAIWTEVIGQTTGGTGCACGVRFESAYVARDRKECYFEEVSAEIEPLFIYISTQNPDFRDYSTLCNDDEVFPVTLIQTAKYRQGWGSVVADQVKLSNFYFNDPWYNSPAVRDAVGYNLNTDLQGYYDEFILTWKAPIKFGENVSGFGLSQFELYEFHFFFPEGGGINFQNSINSWLASVNAEPLSI